MAVNNVGLNIEIRADNRASGPLKDAAAAIKEVSAAQKEAAASAQRWQTLGARSTADIRAEMERVKAALAGIRAANGPFDVLARASQAAGQRLATLRAELAGTAQASTGLAGAFGKLSGLLASIGAGLAVGQIVGAAESFNKLNIALEQSEGSSQAAATALGELFRIAQSTATPINAIGQAYQRYSRAVASVGGTQQQTLQFTEALAGALKLSGASAEEAGSVMLQLSQAFQKGKLNGDEFTSVSENGGRVMDYLAKQLGKSRGELQEMATAGELTSQELLKLGEASQKIADEQARMPKTLGDAWTNFQNELTKTVGSSQAFIAVLQGLGAAITTLGANIDKVIAAIAGMAVVWGLAKVAAMGGLAGIAASMGGVIAAVTAATASVAALKAGLIALSATPWGLALGALAAVVAYVGYDYVAAWAKADQAQTATLDNLKAALKDAETELARLDTEIAQSKASLNGLFDDLDKQYETIGQLGDKTLAFDLSTVKANYDRELALLRATVKDKDRLRQGETDLLARNLNEQLALIQADSARKLDLYRQEYTQKMALAQRATPGTNARADLELKAQQALLGKLKTLWQGQASDYASHLKQLEDQALAHLNRIEELGRQRQQGEAAVAEAINQIRMRGYSEEQRAEALKITQAKELAALRKQLAQGDEEALKKYLALLDQQAQAASQAYPYQRQNGELLTEEARIIQQMNSALAAYQNGLQQRVDLERQAEVSVRAQMELMQAQRDEILQNTQQLNAQLEQGALLKIGADSKLFEDQVTALIQKTEAREAVKLKIGVLDADKAQLEAAANQAVATAQVTIPLETEINPGLLREGLDQAVAQIQPPPVPVTPEVTDAAATAQTLTKDLAQTPATLPVTVDTQAVESELANLDQLTQQRETLIQVQADTQQALADIANLQAAVSNTASVHTITTNAAQALSEILSLNGVNTSSTHTIYVRRVEQNATGGPVGLASGGQPFFPSRRGYITGPGTETSDSIPAMLSRGEFVLRAAAVRKWGLGFLQALNRGFMPAIPRLAMGGAVTPPAVTQSGLPEMAINLSVQGGQPMRLLSSRETARNLTNALRDLQRGR